MKKADVDTVRGVRSTGPVLNIGDAKVPKYERRLPDSDRTGVVAMWARLFKQCDLIAVKRLDDGSDGVLPILVHQVEVMIAEDVNQSRPLGDLSKKLCSDIHKLWRDVCLGVRGVTSIDDEFWLQLIQLTVEVSEDLLVILMKLEVPDVDI
jgi:hypothetical protein